MKGSSVADDAGNRGIGAAERVVGRGVVALDAAAEFPRADALAQIEAGRNRAERTEPVIARIEIVCRGIGEERRVEASLLLAVVAQSGTSSQRDGKLWYHAASKVCETTPQLS